MSLHSRAGTGWLLSLAALAAVNAPAALADPAPSAPQALVKTLDGTLLDVMKNAHSLGYKGRYAKLQPMVRQVYDVAFMTRVAVGAGWSNLSGEQQQTLTDAFGNFIAATYAARFDGYSGEHFQETGERPLGTATLVETDLVKNDGDKIPLDYVTRQEADQWRIVDVFLTGTISELATRRSEFSAVFRDAGYDGLLKTLIQKVAMIEQASPVG